MFARANAPSIFFIQNVYFTQLDEKDEEIKNLNAELNLDMADIQSARDSVTAHLQDQLRMLQERILATDRGEAMAYSGGNVASHLCFPSPSSRTDSFLFVFWCFQRATTPPIQLSHSHLSSKIWFASSCCFKPCFLPFHLNICSSAHRRTHLTRSASETRRLPSCCKSKTRPMFESTRSPTSVHTGN